MAFKSIKRANTKIDEQVKEISDNENNVSMQDFQDMRLRAQKAELALDAMTQANINSGIQNNMRRAISREDVKTELLEALMAHLQNFKVN